MTSSLKTTVGLVAASFLALSSSSLHAQVFNGSFEAPSEAADTLSQDGTNLSVQDFTLNNSGGYAGIVVYGGGSNVDAETGGTGNQGVELFPYYGYHQSTIISGNVSNNDGTAAGSTGIISTALANTSYTLTADVAIPTGYSAPAGEGYQGFVELALIDANNNAVFGSTQLLQTALSVGSFTTESLSFTSGDASSFPISSSDTAGNAGLIALGDGLKLELLLQNGGADQHIPIIFDNVTFSGPSAAIPEPSTYALLFGGLAILGLAVRNSKKLTFNS